MNAHYADVQRASKVRSMWTNDQLRELGELRTLINLQLWAHPDLTQACSPEMEYLRYILRSQETPQQPANGVL